MSLQIFLDFYLVHNEINQDFQVFVFVSKLSKESVGIQESVIRISKKFCCVADSYLVSE